MQPGRALPAVRRTAEQGWKGVFGLADGMISVPEATILIADDTASNLRLLVDMLTAHGYGVREAVDGPTALTIAHEIHPDVILLDIFMPGMDGYEVCTKLKADPDTRDIPVIFISALTDTDNVVKGFDVGGADYITKPFRFREVLVRVAHQITLARQRREIEALHEQDRQHYESLNRIKDDFMRMATHDLRNPLNVILGYTSVLQRLRVVPEHERLVEEARHGITDSVAKMRALVTDILDLAQMEIDSQIVREPHALAPLLERSVNDFRVIAAPKNVTVELQQPVPDVTMLLDKRRMERILDNLVSNAVKYTPAGGRVTLSATTNGQFVSIRVADTGHGIPPKDLPHVFRAFYRVEYEGVEDVESTGLGLSIVKLLVEQHGGLIEVESELGRGSVFKVYLPISPTLPTGKRPVPAAVEQAS